MGVAFKFTRTKEYKLFITTVQSILLNYAHCAIKISTAWPMTARD